MRSRPSTMSLSKSSSKASREGVCGVPMTSTRTGMASCGIFRLHSSNTALITSAKNLFPDKKCTVVFQPHLFTRTRDFATGFAEALGMADEVYLLPIYPARELPIEGVNSQMLADLMHEKSVFTCSKEELLSKVRDQKSNHQLELLITAGAGDIDRMVEQIQEILNAS